MVWRVSLMGAMSDVRYQALHDRLLHMQSVLRLVVCDAARAVEDTVGHDHVAPHRETMADQGAIGPGHLVLVDDEVLVLVTDRLLLVPPSEIRECAPALGVDEVGI